MTRYHFSLAITILFFLGKAATILLAVELMNAAVYQPKELVELGTIITPLFSAYLTIMMKQIFLATDQDHATHMNAAQIFLGFAVPVLEIAFIMGCLLYKRDHMAGLDVVKYGLGATESLFGVYLGIIVSAVFKPSA